LVKAVLIFASRQLKACEHVKMARNTFFTYIFMGRYNHSLSLDATAMVSKNCPTIGEHVVIVFVTQ